MRQRWWLVAVVFVICMGMTRTPGGSAAPRADADGPDPDRPDATGPGAASDAHGPGAHRPDSHGADAPARPQAPGTSTRARPFRAGPCPVGHRPLRHDAVRQHACGNGPVDLDAVGQHTLGEHARQRRRALRRRVDRIQRVRLEHPVPPAAPEAARPARPAPPGPRRAARRRRAPARPAPTARARRSGSSSGKPQSRAARVQQRERDLRRTVLRFHGCLSRVPRSERRVLSLRAGVGRLRPHTRSEVARITHLRRARVVKLERRGLRRLRALNRAGACQDAGASTTAMTAAPGTGTPLPPAGTSGQRGAVLAEHHSSAASKDSGSQGKPERAELSISRPATGVPGGSSFDLALVLGPLAFLAFLLVITREVRRTG